MVEEGIGGGSRARKDVVRQIERGLNTKGEIEQKQKQKKKGSSCCRYKGVSGMLLEDAGEGVAG